MLCWITSLKFAEEGKSDLLKLKKAEQRLKVAKQTLKLKVEKQKKKKKQNRN